MNSADLLDRIERRLAALEHGYHADHLGPFCGSDIVDRSDALRVIEEVRDELAAAKLVRITPNANTAFVAGA